MEMATISASHRQACGAGPAVSIVTICWCNPDELEQTLQSFEGLDPGLVEIIVIDGSPDDSCRKIAEKRLARITHYLHGPDSGRSDAMNKGLDVARGDGIIFINSGDALWSAEDFNKVAKRHRTILRDKIVYGHHVTFIAGSHILRKSQSVGLDDIRTGNFPSHQATIIPREFYKSYRYDPSLHIAFDTKVMRKAFQTLDYFMVDETIAIFANGGVSTVPGDWRQVFRHFSEMVLTRDLTRSEQSLLLVRLIRRKILALVLGRYGLERLQRLKQQRHII